MNNWCIFLLFTHNEMHGSRSKTPVKNLVRQRCAERFKSSVKGLSVAAVALKSPSELSRQQTVTRDDRKKILSDVSINQML
jgi:hypothetical protein